MAKEYYCARCGVKLEITRRAIKEKAIILELVEPHSCEETEEDRKFELKGTETGRITSSGMTSHTVEAADAIEKVHEKVKEKPKLDFDFVKKLNKVEVEPMTAGPGDRRPKSSKREELQTSSAPLNILERASSNAGLASPERDEGEFEDG